MGSPTLAAFSKYLDSKFPSTVPESSTPPSFGADAYNELIRDFIIPFLESMCTGSGNTVCGEMTESPKIYKADPKIVTLQDFCNFLVMKRKYMNAENTYITDRALMDLYDSYLVPFWTSINPDIVRVQGCPNFLTEWYADVIIMQHIRAP